MMNIKKNTHYTLKRARHILKIAYRQFKRRKRVLSSSQKALIVNSLKNLQKEIKDGRADKAEVFAKQAEIHLKKDLRKTSFEKSRDFAFGIIGALLIAVLVRSMWFELYEIPSGSMRPTFEEQDRLTVTKTAFGLNIPLSPFHFYFNPKLLKRSGIIVFTAHDIDMYAPDTKYFYFFPGKKQVTKRLIGKPGDSIYFYGGKIFGVDKFGKDISSELQLPMLSKIDHIPYITMDGRAITPRENTNGVYSTTVFFQMNEPVARLHQLQNNHLYGEMLPLNVASSRIPRAFDHYFDLWGIKNYANARLLTEKQFNEFDNESFKNTSNGTLYLELSHHPRLENAKMRRDLWGRYRPSLNISKSYVPLNTDHLKKIFANIYTARFVVKDGKAKPWGNKSFQNAPDLPGIKNGTYEFYYGKAYKIGFGGTRTLLKQDDPIYTFSIERVRTLFNLGIEFNTKYAPQEKYQSLMPQRFAFYRNNDMYLVGAPVIKNNTQALDTFLHKEYLKQSEAPISAPYYPFEDLGPPFDSNGNLDISFIQKNGVFVPEKSYLVLGDNFAMSGDSRDFGFVPENNIRGAPDIIFWPFGNNFGYVNQPAYTLLTIPRLIIWALAFVTLGVWAFRRFVTGDLPIKFTDKDL